MPSVSEEVARIHWLIKEGKITGEDRCKLVVPKLETKDLLKSLGVSFPIYNTTEELRLTFSSSTRLISYSLYLQFLMSELNSLSCHGCVFIVG